MVGTWELRVRPTMVLAVWGRCAQLFLETDVGHLGYLLSGPTVHTALLILSKKPPEKYFGRVPGSIVAAITAPQSRSPIAIFLTSTTPEERRQPTTINHDVEGHPPCADVRSEMLRNGQRQSLTSSPGHRSLSTLFSREFLAPRRMSKYLT